MSLYTGQEPREIAIHEIGEWYEMRNGTVFRLYEPPHRIFGTDLHAGHVQLLSGQFTVLSWGPQTRLRPSAFRRFMGALRARLGALLGARRLPVTSSPSEDLRAVRP